MEKKPDMDVPVVLPNIGYAPEFGDTVVWIRGAVGQRGKVVGARGQYVAVDIPERGIYYEDAGNLAADGSDLATAAEATLIKWSVSTAGQAYQQRFP